MDQWDSGGVSNACLRRVCLTFTRGQKGSRARRFTLLGFWTLVVGASGYVGAQIPRNSMKKVIGEQLGESFFSVPDCFN